MKQLKYRPDIDGLRALAVLAVVYFHAFPEKLPGGFVGVDIFFVISGFLITQIIHENIKSDTFSFFDFYCRRIKRIFPSLILVLAASFIFGWIFLIFDEFQQLAKHIMSAVTFTSNVTLWNESGYFDNSGETKPLLHLWSLAIEEQFYVFWPLVLWVAWRIKFKLIAVAALLLMASFIFNISNIKNDEIATFYSLLTRAWELLAGASLAIFIDSKKLVADSYAEYLGSIFGFGLIMLSMIILDKESLFPGWWALLPVLGTILVINNGTNSPVSEYILSNKVIVWLGTISYPLYLWHWPLLSFARISEARIPDAHIRSKAILLAILLAWITYKVVEKPIRFGKKIRENTKISALIILMLIMGTLAFFTYIKQGKVFGKGEAIQNLYTGDIGHREFHQYSFEHFYECTPKKIAKKAARWEGYVRCQQSKINQPIDIALIGNSHAEHLFIGLAENLPSKNIVYYVFTGLPSIENQLYEDTFHFLNQTDSIKHIVISMDWAGKYDLDKVEAELLKTADQLIAKGKFVYLIEDVPTFSFDPIRCKGIRFPYKAEMCTDLRKTQVYEAMLNRVIKKNKRIRLIKTLKYFCDEQVCSMTQGNKLLFRDTNHLNVNGSQYLGSKIVSEHIDAFQ